MTLNTSHLNHNFSWNKCPHSNSINNYLVWVLNKTTKYGKVVSRVKTHYGEHKMLSQILFFKTMRVCTSTKLILKGVFINWIHNKVFQIKWLLNFMKYLVIYELIIPFQFHIKSSTHVLSQTNSWMKFFIQMNLNVWKNKMLLNFYFFER